MNKVQWEYIKLRLIIFGCITALILMFVGIAYEVFIVELLIVLATLGFLGLCIAYIVAEIVYRWRVMGVTEAHEKDLFDWYWSYTIFNDKIYETVREIEMGERGEDWEDDYRKAVITYLLKVAEVKRPKLIQ